MKGAAHARPLCLVVLVACVALSAVCCATPAAQRAAAPDGYPWLYLRGGQPPGGDEPLVELAVAGDVMLGRGVADEPDPLGAVAPWLHAADLALANLESTIGQGGTPRPGPYRLQAPPAAAGRLRRAGLDLVSLANNHALDYGPDGLAETVSRLAAAGISVVGVAAPGDGAWPEARIVTVRGVRLAFLAFNQIPDPDDEPGANGWRPVGWDEARAAAAVAAARAGSRADAVIVGVHWGYEYEPEADPTQERATRALLDAGADLVVGHHPHVVQGSAVRDGAFVAYSLGNLVFDQQQGETRQGLALRAFFDKGGLRAVQALPVWAGPRPRLMAPDEAEARALIDRARPAPERIAFACRSDDDLVCEPVAAPERAAHSPGAKQSGGGLFRAGQIDLTGDGQPEQIQVANGKLSVYSGGAVAWRGWPEWQVADVALGDPNDDGRGEMLLALFKVDEASALTSHPFIAGYRSGSYRTLWGGSAVDQPIHEVELADVDGDGRQEMIVLDEGGGPPSHSLCLRSTAHGMVAGTGQAAALRGLAPVPPVASESYRGEVGGRLTVSVWRWHGWGFSLLWRSAPGSYAGLAAVPGQDGQAALIVVEREY